jgi:hypothetical protein
MNWLLQNSDALVLGGFVAALILGPVLYFTARRAYARSRRGQLKRRSSPSGVSPLETLELSDDALFELAGDSKALVLCDWREEPVDIVSSINSFLPNTQQIALAEQGGEVTLSLGIRSVSLAPHQLRAAESPGGVLAIVGAANYLLSPSYELHRLRCSEGTDSLSFMCATSRAWAVCAGQRAFRRVFSQVPMASGA